MNEILPYVLCGCVGLIAGLWYTLPALWRVKRELAQKKKESATHLELASQQYADQKKEIEALRKEAENLRHQNVKMRASPSGELQRALEINVRIYEQMVKIIPGFATTWQNTKDNVISELEKEDAGQIPGKRLATAVLGLFRKRGSVVETLTALPGAKRDEKDETSLLM